MKGKNVSKYFVPLSSSLLDSLDVMNKGMFGIVLIVDDKRVLRGVLTDGDVRRAFLKGASVEDNVTDHMNSDFVYGSSSNSHEENVRLLTENIRHLPILNENMKPIEMISWAEMWRLPVTEPYLGGNELKYVSDCITSSWISSKGSYIKAFERSFEDYFSIEHAITASSGTAALHLALKALDVGPGDEVIMPSLTFGACANVVIHCGGIPVFADVSEQTWTLTPEEFERLVSPKTKAVMPVHLYGHPCEMDSILEIAKVNDISVVEDCAEALGAKYKGELVGTSGDVGCFSFFANKVITTGEGGMVITRNDELAKKIRLLRDHGMSPSKRYWHEVAGFNYRMTNLQAAIGTAQMECIEKFLAHRRNIVNRYTANLSGIDGIMLPPKAEGADNIFWLYSILIDEDVLGVSRDEFMARLENDGIETRPLFTPLHFQPPYPKPMRALPVSEEIARRGISLPTGNDITIEDVDRASNAIRSFVRNLQVAKQVSRIDNAQS